MREDLIKPLPEQDIQSKSIFRLGDKIKARYCGEIPYYPGTIASVNSDGTYDIDYEDGNKGGGLRRRGCGNLSSLVISEPVNVLEILPAYLCVPGPSFNCVFL